MSTLARSYDPTGSSRKDDDFFVRRGRVLGLRAGSCSSSRRQGASATPGS
jgi:hypothetical protein